MSILPLDDRILFKRDAAEAVKGSIILHRGSQTKNLIGTVVEAGPGRVLKNGERAPLEVKAGDRVMISGSGIELKTKDDEFLIVQEEEILVIFDDE